MDIVALFVPWVLLLLCLLVLSLLLFKKWKGVILVLFAVFGINWYFRIILLNVSIVQSEEKADLKVLSFNCNLSPKEVEYYENVAATAELILNADADIVFLTENFYCNYDTLYRVIQKQYPYCTDKHNIAGNRIYSKYRIVCDSILSSKDYPFGINLCQIEYNGTVVNIVGVHLSSNNYNEHMEYMTPDSIGGHGQAKTYLGNIMKAGEHRQEEARQMADYISISNTPTIVMGDFNDVCGSPTLNILEHAGLKDAWWEGGLGYGATIHKPLPYRIDHIMYNDSLKLKSIKKIDASGLSDHDALVAEFYLE